MARIGARGALVMRCWAARPHKRICRSYCRWKFASAPISSSLPVTCAIRPAENQKWHGPCQKKIKNEHDTGRVALTSCYSQVSLLQPVAKVMPRRRVGDGELEGVRRDNDGRGWVPLGLPPRYKHMRLGLITCSVVVACVLLPGCAAFQPPTGRTREGESWSELHGTEMLESPAAAAPRDTSSGAAANAAAEVQDDLRKALEEWHVAYGNLKVALRQLCTGEESCVKQDSGQPAQHLASGVSLPSLFTSVTRSPGATEGAEGTGGEEVQQGGASRETHPGGTSPVTMSWRATSLRGILLQGFTFALSPLVCKCRLPPSAFSHQLARP